MTAFFRGPLLLPGQLLSVLLEPAFLEGSALCLPTSPAVVSPTGTTISHSSISVSREMLLEGPWSKPINYSLATVRTHRVGIDDINWDHHPKHLRNWKKEKSVSSLSAELDRCQPGAQWTQTLCKVWDDEVDTKKSKVKDEVGANSAHIPIPVLTGAALWVRAREMLLFAKAICVGSLSLISKRFPINTAFLS